VSEKAFELGIKCNVIGHQEYEHSGYTKATMRKAHYLPAESLRDRFDTALEVLQKSEDSISYLYIPELDKYGHRNGWQSAGWAALLEEVDSEIRRFVSKLPKDSGVIIVSDHGMMDTADDRKVYIDDAVDQGGNLEFYAGDTRLGYVYLKDASLKLEMLERLESSSDAFTPIDSEAAIAAGWFGQVGFEARSRMPEIFLLARGNFTLFHSVYSKKRSIEMTAHHGGLSSAETRIPLIRIGF
jgi:hypothetical protein